MLFGGAPVASASEWIIPGGEARRGRRAGACLGRFGRRVGELLLDGCVPWASSDLVWAGAGRGGSQCLVAGGADGFAAWGRGCWVRRPVVAGSVLRVWPGSAPGSSPPVGLSGGAAGRGVRSIMLCGARVSRGAVGPGNVSSASIHASALAGRQAGVRVWG